MVNRLKPGATARIKLGYDLVITYEDGSEQSIRFAKYSSAIQHLADHPVPDVLTTATIKTIYSEPGVPVKLEVKHDV